MAGDSAGRSDAAWFEHALKFGVKRPLPREEAGEHAKKAK